MYLPGSEEPMRKTPRLLASCPAHILSTQLPVSPGRNPDIENPCELDSETKVAIDAAAPRRHVARLTRLLTAILGTDATLIQLT